MFSIVFVPFRIANSAVEFREISVSTKRKKKEIHMVYTAFGECSRTYDFTWISTENGTNKEQIRRQTIFSQFDFSSGTFKTLNQFSEQCEPTIILLLNGVVCVCAPLSWVHLSSSRRSFLLEFILVCSLAKYLFISQIIKKSVMILSVLTILRFFSA